MEIKLRDIYYYVLLLLGRMGNVGIISSYYTSHFKNKNIEKNVMYLIVIVPLLKIIPFSYLIY